MVLIGYEQRKECNDSCCFSKEKETLVNKRFCLGILVLIFGMTVVEAQSNKGGEFTLINIPSKYDGKYAVLEGYDEDSLELIGCDSIKPPKPSRIIDGKVIIPMWVKRSNGKIERYSGNHSSIEITIHILENEKDFFGLNKDNEIDANSLDDDIDFFDSFFRGDKDHRVKFSNGNVTKAYNERTIY